MLLKSNRPTPLGLPGILLIGLFAFSQPVPSWGEEPSPVSAGAKLSGDAVAEAPSPEAGIRVLLTAAQETTLSSRLDGVITNITVSHGAAFTKDKPLVSMDCREPEARLAMSEAELAAARENYESKLRMQGLAQASAVDVALAASEMSKTQAQVKLYKVQVDRCTVTAPFKGRVAKLTAKPYQSVGQGQPLMDIVAAGPLVLRLNVPAAWTQWLKPGTTFTVSIDETGKPYPAKITALNSRVDAVSQTMEVEGVLTKESAELLPGMSGTAFFNPPAR